MTALAEQTGIWLDLYAKQAPGPEWVRAMREAGFARFAELGFPTTHDEEWRFTNVSRIARTAFRAGATEVTLRAPKGVEQLGRELEIGEMRAHPDGLRNGFEALNMAFTDRVTFLRVPRGAVIEQPIEIGYNVDEADAAVHPRTVIAVEENAQCSIVETYTGAGRYLTNAVTEIAAGAGAVVDHYKVQREGAEAFHIAALRAQLGRSANFSTTSISLGGALVRNDVIAVLSEGTEATLNGLYLANGTQHVDNHTEIDHAKPHGTSHEMYKGILDGKSSAVFNGRILVRKDAQKTDSKQTNKNLVLSDEAVIDTKPELQIFADDVRCTHGATIGQLDAESLFYLQSRGIGKHDARNLLTYAFAQDIIDRIKIQALRESLERGLFEKFHESPR
ncbi:MAG TPA: Fe-S cluster assembly protein SufD [Bryobacteraceae bacterium]|nr:Fe-S cluster assembly protein SufD [Bryobacteraceae bacterium]